MTFKRKLRWALHSFLGRTITILARLQGRLVPTGIEGAEDEDGAFEPLTAEQHAVIRRAEPKVRGRVVATLLPDDDIPGARLTSEFIDLERADTEKRRHREKLLEDPGRALPAPTTTGPGSSECPLERSSAEAGIVRESADSIQSSKAEPDEAAAALKAKAE